MRTACPACPDGNEWSLDGPTGRACPVRKGKAYLQSHLEIEYDLEESDSPYCECGNDPIEDELASNKCDACGKPLE